jgi:hypothetical protein
MADPLSIAASVVGVAGAGVKLSTILFRYAETFPHAERSIREIARDLSIISSTITQLGILLGQEIGTHPQKGSVLAAADETVTECHQVFTDMHKLLIGCLDARDESKEGSVMAMFKRLKYPMVETRLNIMHLRLEGLKTTLTLVLSLVSYATKYEGKVTRR